MAGVCRQMGVRETKFYLWQKKYAQLATSEIRELRQLREENAKLQRWVADLSLDKHLLTEVIRKIALGAGTQVRPRFVDRRTHVLLRRYGWGVNRRRVRHL